MEALPYEDGAADLFVSFSGLHMVADPARAVIELARCTKPGGELVGTTFLREGDAASARSSSAGRRSATPSRRPARS